MKDDRDGSAPGAPLADRVEKLRAYIDALDRRLEQAERWLDLHRKITDEVKKQLRTTEDAEAREVQAAADTGSSGGRRATEEGSSRIRQRIDFWHEQLRVSGERDDMLGRFRTELLGRLRKAREDLARIEAIGSDRDVDRES